MRLVVQRVASARVEVDGKVVGAIDGPGLLFLVGVTHDDIPATAARLAEKAWQLRILADEKSCAQVGAPLLVVSQFTLYADTRKGRRPSWNAAAPREISWLLVDAFVRVATHSGGERRHRRVGADMQVALGQRRPGDRSFWTRRPSLRAPRNSFLASSDPR